MDCFSPLKIYFLSVILLALATRSYAYQLPGDPPASGSGRQASELSLNLSDQPLESSLTRHGNDAATLDYKLKQISGLSLATSYSNRLVDPFATDAGLAVNGFWGVSLKSRASAYLPAIEMDYAVGGFDGDTGNQFEDTEHHRIKINTKGKIGFLDYGTHYNLIGSEYEVVDKKKEKLKNQDKNKSITNSWIGKSLGKFYVSQFLEQTQKNVDNDDKPETHDSLVGTSVMYTLFNWPYVATSISHASGTRESISSTGHGVFKMGLQSTKGSLIASHKMWNATMTLSRTQPESRAGHFNGQAEATNFYVGGTYSPSKTLSISPYVNRNVQTYQDWGVESESTSTAVSVIYSPRDKNYKFNFYMSHDSQENLDWGMDNSYLYSQAAIRWGLGRASSASRFISLIVGYNQYENHLYSSANSSDVSVRIEFRSNTLDNLLRTRSHFRENNYKFINGLSATPFDDDFSQAP